MKKSIFILLMAGFLGTVYSQGYQYIPFPTSGAIWSEVYFFSESEWPKIKNYERFTLNGEDTIMNGISYKKLYLFCDSVFNKSTATCVGGIREDQNKRIFYKGNWIHSHKPRDLDETGEVLLYDFSVAVGDTLRGGNGGMYNLYWLIVNRIDTVEIGGTLRKRIRFDDIPWVEWIEGIGNIRGLLFTSGDLPIDNIYNDLICFKQNGVTQYYNTEYPDCFPVLHIEAAETVTRISVYPNPASNYIHFNFGENNIKSIVIIDCNGNLCGSYDVQMQSELVLPTKQYRPGFYVYKAIDSSWKTYTGKFIVK